MSTEGEGEGDMEGEGEGVARFRFMMGGVLQIDSRLEGQMLLLMLDRKLNMRPRPSREFPLDFTAKQGRAMPSD